MTLPSTLSRAPQRPHGLLLLLMLALMAATAHAQVACSTSTLTNGHFELGSKGTPALGWTQIDIKTPGDFAQVGIQPSSSLVRTMDNGNYLNIGRSSIFYQQVVAEAVPGATYHASAFYATAGKSYSRSRFYFTTAAQTPSLSVAPSSSFPVSELHASGSSGANGMWLQVNASFVATAADAGKPVYLNMESYRDVLGAQVAFDSLTLNSCPTTTATTTITTTTTTTTTTIGMPICSTTCSFSGSLTDSSPFFQLPSEELNRIQDYPVYAYAAYPFMVSTTNTYIMRMESDPAFDTFLILYEAPFDCFNPLDNAIAANDDYDLSSTPSAFRMSLTAGTAYVLVATSSGPFQSGTFTLQIKQA